MLALIRKDLAWVLPLFVACAAALCLVAASNDVSHTWVFVQQRMWSVLHLLLWGPAVLAGGVLAMRDPICGTREHLRHRSVSPMQVYRAQVLLGLCFVVGMALVMLLFDLARLGMDERIGLAFIDLMPLALVMSGSILALACFCITLISLRLPLSWSSRVFALFVLGFTVILLQSLSTSGWERGGFAADMTVHLLVMTLLVIFLLWVGRRCTAIEHDPDVPLPLASARAILGLSLPLLLLSATLAVSLLQHSAREPLHGVRPLLIETEEHGLTLAHWDENEGYTLVSADRELLAEKVRNYDVWWKRGGSQCLGTWSHHLWISALWWPSRAGVPPGTLRSKLVFPSRERERSTPWERPPHAGALG